MANSTERTFTEEQTSTSCLDRFQTEGAMSHQCFDLLHDVHDAFAGVITNARAMDSKLPSYSRSRRYIHEIERNAFRGGELVKRLLRQFGTQHTVEDMFVSPDQQVKAPPPEVIAARALQEPFISSCGEPLIEHQETGVAPAFLSTGRKGAHNEL